VGKTMTALFFHFIGILAFFSFCTKNIHSFVVAIFSLGQML